MAKNYNQALQLNNADLQAILSAINELPEANNGVELPTLTNEGSASDILSGKELIDGEGNIVTGTMPNNGAISSTMDGINTKSVTIPSGYTSGGSVSLDDTIDNEVTTQEGLITQIMTVIDELPEAGAGGDTEMEDGLIMRTISGNYENNRVTVVGANAFANCIKLTTVNFPNATFIGFSAFEKCSSLTTVSFPKTTTIEAYAFSSCSRLTTISFPACTFIRDYAFANCSSLTTASFPACREVKGNAFANCSSLTTISFPACTSIGNYAFAKCSSLTTASFPACTFMGDYAFASCSSLTTISFPACTSIGNYAFANCSSLTTASFPLAIRIGGNAFSNCSNLTTISCPVATTIGDKAFFSCHNLTTVDFPMATIICEYAFSSCSSLTTASFPACTRISSVAFIRCYNFISLYLTGSSVCTLQASNAFASTPIGGYSASAGTYGSIFVPASLVDAYKSASNWSYFADRITAFEE